MRRPSAFLLFARPVQGLGSSVFPLRHLRESWATGVISANHGPMTSHEPLHMTFMFLIFRDPLVMGDGRRQGVTCLTLFLCARCCHLELELHIVC